jgi:5'-3' exonuclease
LKTIALLDGDILAFQSACAAEQRFEFGTYSCPDKALLNIDRRMQTVKEATEADEMVVAFSCPSRHYFRHDLLPSYKAGRGQKPEALKAVRERIEAEYKTYTKPHLEADDVLGILATWPKFVGKSKVIIVTSDKDLRQIPGLHLNPDKLERGVEEVTPEEGTRFHYFQTLTGDAVDGYSGCPGIGPVKAEKILNNWSSREEQEQRLRRECAWVRVVHTFENRGLTESDALVQARVARILQAEDWDFEKKEPKLWNP